MKKITALILMVALLAVCIAPAFADRPVPDDGYVPKREWRLCNGKGAYYLNQSSSVEDSWEGGSYKANITKTGIFGSNKLQGLEVTENYTREDEYFGHIDGKFHVVVTSSGQIVSGEEEYWEMDESGAKTKKKAVYDGKVWRDSETGEELGWGTDYSWLVEDYEPEFKWYKNTVCLLGLPIRDLKPSLTDKWYTIVPVDLTHDATYTYPMIAGSIYYLGECQVTVKDGQVTTDFSLPEGLCWDEKHCLQWFTSLDDITTDFLNNPVGAHTFGQPVSIANDLKGQDVALLFICNQAEYRIPLFYSNKCFLTRFYSTQDHVKAAQADMTALLAKIQ